MVVPQRVFDQSGHRISKKGHWVHQSSRGTGRLIQIFLIHSLKQTCLCNSVAENIFLALLIDSTKVSGITSPVE